MHGFRDVRVLGVQGSGGVQRFWGLEMLRFRDLGFTAFGV